MAKRKIVICMGSSCFARGNETNLRIIEQFIKDNRLDAEILLAGSTCAGKCASGPNVSIDGVIYNHMDREALTDLLNKTFKTEN